MDKLNPCPFCNEHDEIWVCKMNYRETYIVECQNCGARGPKIPTSNFGLCLPENGEKEAIKRWNDRGNKNVSTI